MTLDEIKERTARSLRRNRIEGGYTTAEDFAKAAGIKGNRYREYERGRRGLSIEDACTFADILGVTLDELVGRDFRRPGDVSLDPDDVALVERYRSLDDRGRESVDSMIETQRALAGLDGAGLEGVGA